jgi:hypothetical protein
MTPPSQNVVPIITPRVASITFVVLVVACSVLFRIPRLNQRPIQVDELITLQNYTWAGVYSDGTRRELRRQVDVDSLEGASLRRSMIGLFCSLGRWPEPNNHVVHSVLTNFALFAPCSTLTSIRLPPLLCCGAFALLSAWLCLRCNLLFAAPLVALLAMWHPYCIQYSQESRGYALMLALCVGLILLLQEHTVRMGSLVWSSSVVAVACATIENLVNLSVDWVMPVLLGSLIAPTRMLGISFEKSEFTAWRRSILCQILVVSGIGFTFLMDRLPYVYSSAQQYGVPCSSIADLMSYRDESLRSYMPTVSWGAVFCVGILGAGMASLKKDARCIVGPWIVAGVASAIHFAVAKKLPYVRNLGYFLPLFLLGYGFAIELIIKLSTRRFAQVTLATATTAVCIWAIMSTANVDLIDRDYVALEERLVASDRGATQRRLLLLGNGVASTISLSVSVQEAPEVLSSSSREIQVIIIEKTAFPFSLVGQLQMPAFQLTHCLESREVEEIGPYRIYRLAYSITDPSDWDGNSPAVCVWSPRFESVSVSDQSVLKALEDNRMPYSPLYSRYQAKLEVFSRLERVVVDVSPTDVESTMGACAIDRMKSIVDRFGGESTLLTPVQSR